MINPNRQPDREDGRQMKNETTKTKPTNKRILLPHISYPDAPNTVTLMAVLCHLYRHPAFLTLQHVHGGTRRFAKPKHGLFNTCTYTNFRRERRTWAANLFHCRFHLDSRAIAMPIRLPVCMYVCQSAPPHPPHKAPTPFACV